jgi:hypothetical protein
MQPHLAPRRGSIVLCLLAAAFASACGTDAFSDDAQSDDDNSNNGTSDEHVVMPQPDGTDTAPDGSALIDPDGKIETLIASCGDGTLRSNAPLRRAPYVQKVTPTSAVIGWGSTNTSEQHVDITTPAGELVMSAPSVVESSVMPTTGMQQLHWATIEGLAPDTVYCYSLATGYDAFTVRAGFRTAPAPDRDRTIRFIAFGDSGTGNADQRTVFEQMRKLPQELMIHVGDMAYYDATPDQFQTSVFDVYASVMKYVPMFPIAGNHEHVTADAQPFRDAFALSNNERWYSFDWGSIHFAAIDTEVSLSTQAAWLEADLAATDRPWKIVFCHRPPYSSGSHGSQLDVRAMLAPIVERHGVQLVLTGHEHDYERTSPQNGVTYVVTGGAGGGLRAVGTSDFTEVSASTLNFVQIEVTHDTLTLHALDGAGVEIDTVDIPRDTAN